MCSNAIATWYQEDDEPGINYFGVDSMPDAWLGKLEQEGGRFRWSYCFDRATVLTGTVPEEDRGREIIETFQQALDLAQDFVVSDVRGA